MDPPRAVAAGAEFDLVKPSVVLDFWKRTLSSERAGGCVEDGVLSSVTVLSTFRFAILLLKGQSRFYYAFRPGAP